MRVEVEERVDHGSYNTIWHQQMAVNIMAIIQSACGKRKLTQLSGVLNEMLIVAEFVEVHRLLLSLMFITVYTRVRQILVPYTVNIS